MVTSCLLGHHISSMALDLLWYRELAEASVLIGVCSYYWPRSFGVVGFSCTLNFMLGLNIGYWDDVDFSYLLLHTG